MSGKAKRLEEDQGASFDDGTIPSAIDFAFSLRDTLPLAGIAEPTWLSAMIDDGLDFILESQHRCGGWPQQYGAGGYHALMTLNDGAMSSAIHILLKAHHRTGDHRYLEAAKRAGDFLIAAQGPDGQSGWAQQYSPDCTPRPARAMEPAGLASLETAYAMISLFELYAHTGDNSLYGPLMKSRDWLLKVQISPGRWARFYEPRSNTPLYADRKGALYATLSQLPPHEQESYRWEGGEDLFPEIAHALNLAGILETGGREALAHALPQTTGLDLFLSAYPTARLSADPEHVAEYFRNTPAPSDGTLHHILSTQDLATTCAALAADLARYSIDQEMKQGDNAGRDPSS